MIFTHFPIFSGVRVLITRDALYLQVLHPHHGGGHDCCFGFGVAYRAEAQWRT